MKVALGTAIGLAALVAALGANGTVSKGVPPGFDLSSIAAASANDVWLLGDSRCCNAIVRTSDGGRTFVRVSAPPLPTQGDVPQLRFADRRDGYVFVDSLFYGTHDGGTSWRRISLGTVLSVATGGGRAYALTSRGLETSPVSSDRWRSTAVRFDPTSIAAFGSSVWILGSKNGHEKLAKSTDGGRTFITGAGPCYPDLGGQLTPASARLVWAVCPTGMLAGALKSTDGGRSFKPVVTPYPIINAAMIAAASSTTAVLASAPGRPLLRTKDGGAIWRPARDAPGRVESFFALAFADARVGYALVQIYGERQVLWRTADAGATWHAVPIR